MNYSKSGLSFTSLTTDATHDKINPKTGRPSQPDAIVKVLKLTDAQVGSVRGAFDDNRGVDDKLLASALHGHILPRFQKELGWSAIRSIKRCHISTVPPGKG